jgi:Ankyrin repeats (3 copies)
LPIVSFLITAGANVNAVTQRRITPLHVAAQKGNGKIIQLLVEAGANVNVCSGVGCTPLHEAAANGQKAAVLQLLALKADPDMKDSRYHLTAANLAHANGQDAIREILCDVMTYQQRFIQNINFILFNWKRIFLPHSAEFSFIDKLAHSIVLDKEADELFKKISAALKSPEYAKVQTNLSEMRTLLIANMKQYNTDKVAAKQALPVSENTTSFSLT